MLVQHRVQEKHKLVPKNFWDHCPGTENPVGIPTRSAGLSRFARSLARRTRMVVVRWPCKSLRPHVLPDKLPDDLLTPCYSWPSCWLHQLPTYIADKKTATATAANPRLVNVLLFFPVKITGLLSEKIDPNIWYIHENHHMKCGLATTIRI